MFVDRLLATLVQLRRGATHLWLRTLADVVDHHGASGTSGIVDGTEIRVRRPAAKRKHCDEFVSGKDKQNGVKSMVVTEGEGRGLLVELSTARKLRGHHPSPTPASWGFKLLADGPTVEILADAGHQGLGARTGGRVMTPPHREFKKNAPDWYEEMRERSARHTPHAESGSSTASHT